MSLKTLVLTVAIGMTGSLSALAVAACSGNGEADRKTEPKAGFAPAAGSDAASDASDASDAIPGNVKILMKVYPDWVKGYKNGSLVMSDGSTIVYDDGKKKSFEQLLDDADVEDMFAFKYDRSSWVPGHMQDAGRSRNEQLFKKMYGASAAAVAGKLVNVQWPFGAATNGGGVNMKRNTVRFTPVNGAADSLRAVVAELQRHPQLHKYLAQSGSFYWRPVRGAKRLSAHSYGMTIDIGVKYSNYWRNVAKSETAEVKYANQYPHEIVEIFERHGFIWGGRWYHYDTMHFEFRPEILMANP